jgi:uncharacterized protein (TIGR02145 family)
MRFAFTILLLLLNFFLRGQAPALIPFQAIARNAAGEPLASSALNARFTMHDGTASGAVVWQELQTVSTSALGLFTAQLGSSVSLTNVNWDGGSKFIQVELDLGNGFIDIGTQQMLSVPYALHAGSVHLNVSASGDTLFVGDGSYVIIPGISEANSFTTGTTLHTCGAPNVHNPDLTYGTMTDQEGNVYKTIAIGTQVWMAENLNTSIYRNGDAIATGLSDAAWNNSYYTQAAAWAYYNNDSTLKCPYGKLYNWYACIDDRQICPMGWHMPSEAEWGLLVQVVDSIWGVEIIGNSYNTAGGAMKSLGTIDDGMGLWIAPNEGASNASGFSSLPAGYKNGSGGYNEFGSRSIWWTSTAYFAAAISFNIRNISYTIEGGATNRRNGLSVRCIRD